MSDIAKRLQAVRLVFGGAVIHRSETGVHYRILDDAEWDTAVDELKAIEMSARSLPREEPPPARGVQLPDRAPSVSDDELCALRGLADVVGSMMYAAPETRSMWETELVEAYRATRACGGGGPAPAPEEKPARALGAQGTP